MTRPTADLPPARGRSAHRRWDRRRFGPARRRGMLAVPAMLLVASVSACGSPGRAEPAAGSASSTPSASSAPATTPASSAAAGAGGSAFCATARAAFRTDQQNAAIAALANGTATAGDWKIVMEANEHKYARLAEAAPPEIKPELQVIAAATREAAARFEQIGYDPKKITSSLMAPLRTPRFAAAGTKVQAYLKAACGLEANTTPG